MASFHLYAEIRASRDLLWRSIATPEGLARWQADEVLGAVSPGQILNFAWPGLGVAIQVEVLELIDREKISFRFGVDTLTLSLTRGGLELQYESDGERDWPGLKASWGLALAQLKHSAERHPSRQRQVFWAEVNVQIEPEAFHFYFTEALGLQKWFCEAAHFSLVSRTLKLEQSNLPPLHARVIFDDGNRDVLLAFEEAGEATLALRTIPLHDGSRKLACSLSSWGGPQKLIEELRANLSPALTRLKYQLAQRSIN